MNIPEAAKLISNRNPGKKKRPGVLPSLIPKFKIPNPKLEPKAWNSEPKA
jgi:hypothetical protein